MTNRERHDVLRRMLEERRGEIQEKLRAIREEIPSYQDEVRDTEEQSVTDFAQEMDFALMEMKAADPDPHRRGPAAGRRRARTGPATSAGRTSRRRG